MISLENLLNDFQSLKNAEKAQVLTGFFKTGKGQYGEGDVFLGIKVPEQRKLAKKYSDISLKEVEVLLQSGIHEQRLTALLILINKYKKADSSEKQKFFNFYLKNTKFINNWDLVDLSAPSIVGHYLFDKDKSILIELSKSSDLWKKRIAMVSTYYFIKNNKFNTVLQVAKNLLNDKHDLIHKAVGWMLRETGKRSILTEEEFLQKHYRNMPRTALRYAIEKFPEAKRKFYLAKQENKARIIRK